MATAAKTNKSGFYIEVTCPGCGGTLELDSDFFVLQCDHCGCVHRVVMPNVPVAYLIPAKIDKRRARFNIDRHLKKKSLPLTGSGMHLKRFYYPYWKVDAVLFRLRNKVYERVISEESEYRDAVTVTQDRTEVSLSPYTTTRAAGMQFEGIPASIGVRAEYTKMVPYSRENAEDEFDALPILTSWENLRTDLLLNVGLIGDIDESNYGSNVTELFHPRVSLVYFPFLVFESYSQQGFSRYIVDGVSGRVVDHVTEIDTQTECEYPESPSLELGALSVEHHRCPTCGVDLPGEQSYIYICPNCHELIVLGDNGMVARELWAVPTPGTAPDRMFPFWSLKIPAEAGLHKMFGGLHGSNRLVIPAFESRNFDAVYRLTKRMSAAVPQLEFRGIDKLDSRHLPVSVSIDEALLLTEIIIYRESFARPNRAESRIQAFEPEDIRLIYVPFHPEHYFYVDSVINTITFEKSLVT